MQRVIVGSLMSLSLVMVLAATPSQYAGEENRSIKALSEQEVADYLAGKGAGFAKAAELNHYPGPRHVLDLADQLELTAAQERRSQEIFDVMQSRAVVLGTRLVAKERELDQEFAKGTIKGSKLDSLLGEIGKLQSELRATHLRAHIEERTVLSPEQALKYDQLRGYGESHTMGGEHHH